MRVDPRDLFDILPRDGPQSAVVGRQLALCLGWTLRDITAATEWLRLHHVPVLSDPVRGYWLYTGAAGDVHAARMCVASLAGRIDAQAASLDGLRQGLGM